MNYPTAYIQYCEALTMKVTALRKAVLFILWSEKKPLKAYEILTELLHIKPNATPPTIYRALDFFVEVGIVHKIESIQSYTLCCEPIKQLSSEVLMVCQRCHRVVEIYDDAIRILIANLTALHAFKIHQDAIELKGICSVCSW